MKLPLCLAVVVALLLLDAEAAPEFNVPATINLGTPINIHYTFTDAIDGRFMTISNSAGQGQEGTGKFVSKTGNDWIGLFAKGECDATSASNNQDRHKCWKHWAYVPQGATSGTISFQADEYKSAGDYEARYFYGDDPTIPGTYKWMGQGYVCNTWLDSNGDGNINPTSAEMNTGLQGGVATTNVELAQCQCDPALSTQVLTLADGTTPTVDMATCHSYRAACGRCALDAAATSSTIQVIGTAGVDVYQDMSHLAGFEIGF
jgi:hypothetical protein